MKKIYSTLLLLFMISSLNAQDCNKTCQVEEQINKGVFLGVQITSSQKVKFPRVMKVVEGTQADLMGIQKGDLIYKINDVNMEGVKFMVEWVGAKKAGDAVTIELKRKGQDMVIKGELGFKTSELVTKTVCCDQFAGKLMLTEDKIYPNPSQGEFVLQFEVNKESPIDAKILDFQGNLIFETTITPKGNQVFERLIVNPNVSGDHILILTQDGLTTERKLVFIR